MAETRSAAGTKVVLIAGPTASGKSRLALDLARLHGGTVINADSMQVYAELRVLTARPSLEDEMTVPHRLYGCVPAATRYSVGRWLRDVVVALGEARGHGRLPIVVGGTGLYFKALCEGLAEIPPIPPEVREQNRTVAEGLESAALHNRLAEIDPDDARRIRPSDRSRILRALDVFVATGRSLADWQANPAAPVLDPQTVERLILDPEREVLHRRIKERAGAMIAAGAIDEAKALAALRIAPDLPAMKAIGVRQLVDHAAGKSSLETALAGIETETRRYARRQLTWFRNQMGDWRPVG